LAAKYASRQWESLVPVSTHDIVWQQLQSGAD
jgi:hypothetical protein